MSFSFSGSNIAGIVGPALQLADTFWGVQNLPALRVFEGTLLESPFGL